MTWIILMRPQMDSTVHTPVSTPPVHYGSVPSNFKIHMPPTSAPSIQYLIFLAKKKPIFPIKQNIFPKKLFTYVSLFKWFRWAKENFIHLMDPSSNH